MDVERKLWYLRRLNLFAAMSPAEIEAVASRLRDRSYRRRETVLDPHTPADRVYLVKSGAVRIYQLSAEGREVTTAILRPGQLLGTSALVGVGERSAFAEATEDSYICEATAEEFLRILAGHPLLATKVTVALARQLLRLEQQLERLALQQVPVRLAQVLLQLAEDNGGPLPEGLTHEELAKLIGSTRETVTKILAGFAERGLVELGYRRLTITDPAGLRLEAGVDGD